MRYRANSSSSCLLVVLYEVIRRGFAPVFCSSILKVLFPPVWLWYY
nr:MAG TPA: hypothetical protein [Caudoviricetes sp.]